MLYTDILFVFAFLPIALALTFILREPWERNLSAVVMSLIFLCWGRHLYYALIILPVFAIYFAGRLLKKSYSRNIHTIGGACALVFSAFAVISLGDMSSLSSSICSVGFFLFASRCLVYLDEIKNGAEPETDFLSLAVYLISYEFMLISPLSSYSRIKNSIKTRELTLTKAAAGIEIFIRGLFRASVLGFAFERVRYAALLSDATPWMNQLVGILACAVGFYVTFSAYGEMSQGLALMDGVATENCTVGITARSTVSAHVRDFYESGAILVQKSFTKGKSAWQLVLTSVIVGVSFGFGAGWCAFIGLLLLAMMLEALSDTKTFSDGIVTFIVVVAGYILLACSSPDGIARLVSSLNKNAYEFDMSYALYSELMRSAFWLALGVISITPVYKWVYTFIREKMSASDRSYGVMRVMGAVITLVMLILSAIAMVSVV